MRVLLWPVAAHPLLQEQLGRLSGASVRPVSGLADIADDVAEAEAVVMSGNMYDAAVATALRNRAGKLRLVHLLTAGYEGPATHGVPDGVVVCNAGGAHSPMVAEHALTLLLALIRQIPAMAEQQRLRRWDRTISAQLRSLEDATVAIIGFGSIGREIAIRARPFGCRLIAVTRSRREALEVDETYELAALPEVLPRADAIIVALPLHPETRNLLNAKAFALCRPGALLVNIARGALLDQEALLAALASGRIGAAALDVAVPEPLPPDSPLWAHPRVTISPHVAGVGGAMSRQRLADLVCDNIARLRDGMPLRSQVMGERPAS